MRQFFAVFDGLLPTATSVFPWVAALFVAVAILRSRWLGKAIALRVSLVDAVLTYSALLIFHLVSAPQPVSASAVRVVPGTDLGEAVQAAPGDLWPWLQLLGNLALLFPLGALLPLRVSWFGRFRRLACGALVATCAIEFTQLTVFSGRVVSVDDILLNTSGAMLGAMSSRKWWDEFRGLARPPWILWWNGLRAAPSGRHALHPRYARSGGASA